MKDRLIELLDKVQLHGVDLPVDRERYPSDEVSMSNERIAEHLVDNGVTIRERGKWIVTDADSGSFGEYAPFIEFKCPKCESCYGIESGQYDWQYGDPIPWVSCPLCGADMRGE